MTRCFRCHRPLRTPEARKAGIGPTCARIVKQLALIVEEPKPDPQFDLFAAPPVPNFENTGNV